MTDLMLDATARKPVFVPAMMVATDVFVTATVAAQADFAETMTVFQPDLTDEMAARKLLLRKTAVRFA